MQPIEEAELIVIGAGQAGLATAFAARQAGLEAVVLEASDAPGGSWRSYYDSLRLFSPARFSSLPGRPFPGDGDRYPTRDEVVDYLAGYAEWLAPDLRLGQRVARVAAQDDGLLIHTAAGAVLRAPRVISATGYFGTPHRPALPGLDTFTGRVLHSSEYRSPESFAGQRVLVVGAGNSAVQIAVELAAVADVTLASRSAPRWFPQRPLGRDVHWWLTRSGLDRFPLGGRWLGRRTQPVLDDGRYRRAVRAGRPDRRPLFAAFDGDAVQWSDGRRESVDVVLLATGFRPDVPFLAGTGAADMAGRLLHRRGLSTAVAGLGHVGLEFQRGPASASLRGVGRDAGWVVANLTAGAPRPAAEVPGPRAPRPLQSWLGIVRPLETRLAMRRRYGGVFRTNDSIAGELFHIADRDLVERMFKWKPPAYNVAEPRQIMEPVVGAASLLLLDQQPHLRMRKLLLPPFHGESLAHYAGEIEQITDREIDRWRPGDTVRMRSVAQAISSEVIVRTVFGVSDPGRVAELKRRLPRLSSINPAVLLFQRDLGPLSPWGRFLRQRARVDEMLYEEIDRRRSAPPQDGRRDILTLLLAARDDDGRGLTDRELRDELVTILLAGHETTATSIGWAFERLLRTPEALARLTAEVAADGGGDYLDAVVKETLRVRPVVTEVFRSPTERTELGGYVFEPGAQLAAAIGLVGHDPVLYGPDPLAFRPERFLEGAPEPYTWVPFGGGVRRCIGAAFAELEMRVVIATIVRRARLRAPGPRAEKARFRGATVIPSRGGRAVVESVS